ASRFSETKSAVHTMSQRPAVRSGMRASKPVFLIWSWRPKALATARAPSTSKPTAWFGSVTLAEEKNSMGEYSMSTQSVSVPDLIRLVGGVTDTFDEGFVPDAVLVPPQPAMTSANPNRTAGITITGRFLTLTSRNDPSRGARNQPFSIAPASCAA